MTFLKDKKGVSGALMSLFIAMFLMQLFMLAYDIGFLYIKKYQLSSALKFANINTYKVLDIDRLREGELYINSVLARDVFEETFKNQLKLDSSFMPASESSPAAGEVIITHFIVKNESDPDTLDSLGNLMKNLSVHSRALMPVKPTFMGYFGKEFNIPAAVTTDAPFIDLTNP